jgi:Zn-dependent protease
MLKFRLMGIPVVVDWWFWLTGVLLGGGINARGPEDWTRVGVWCLVMFVSVLVHEFGHALTARRFGVQPGIQLHGFGGATFLPGARFTRGQSIMVSAAGPIAGLALAMVVLIVARAVPENSIPPIGWVAIRAALFIGFVWTALNLLPIQPLDGGQILREILGPNRLQLTAMIGGVLAVVVAVWALRNGQLFMALILGLLAFQNFRREPPEGGVVKG